MSEVALRRRISDLEKEHDRFRIALELIASRPGQLPCDCRRIAAVALRQSADPGAETIDNCNEPEDDRDRLKAIVLRLTGLSESVCTRAIVAGRGGDAARAGELSHIVALIDDVINAVVDPSGDPDDGEARPRAYVELLEGQQSQHLQIIDRLRGERNALRTAAGTLLTAYEDFRSTAGNAGVTPRLDRAIDELRAEAEKQS